MASGAAIDISVAIFRYGRPPEVTLDKFHSFGSSGMTGRDGVVVFFYDFLAKGIYVRYEDAVMPASKAIGIGPTRGRRVFVEKLLGGIVMCANGFYDGVRFVGCGRGTDKGGRENGDIVIVGRTCVVVGSAGECV